MSEQRPKSPPFPSVRVKDFDGVPTWRVMGPEARRLSCEWVIGVPLSDGAGWAWSQVHREEVDSGRVYLIQRNENYVDDSVVYAAARFREVQP